MFPFSEDSLEKLISGYSGANPSEFRRFKLSAVAAILGPAL